MIPDLASNASRVVLFCLFGARPSSCSSTGACDFVVGSTDCATSISTTLSGTKVSTLSPLGCWLLSTAADDGCALATIGLGKFGTGFGGALTPSPLPTCNGEPEIAGTTITSFRSTACLVAVGASPAAASAGRPATCVPLMATTGLEFSRSDVGSRRIVRATTMPTLVPMKCALLVCDRPNHKPYLPAASQLRKLERRILPHDRFSKR